MRNRIDLRWILSTAVVVAVAAAGTAATMRMRATGADDLESSLQAPASLSRINHRVAEVEPARLSHGTGAASAELSAFKSEALPPMLGQEAFLRSRPDFPSPDNMSIWGTRSASSSSSASGSYWSGSGSMAAGGQVSGGIGSAGGASIAGTAKGTSGDVQPSHTSGSNGSSEGSPGAGSPAAGAGPGAARPGAPAGPPAASPVGGLLPALPPAGAAGGALVGSGGGSLTVEAPSPVAFDADPGQPFVGPGALSPTPEPGSLLLIGTGLVGMAGALRRRFNK